MAVLHGRKMLFCQSLLKPEGHSRASIRMTYFYKFMKPYKSCPPLTQQPLKAAVWAGGVTRLHKTSDAGAASPASAGMLVSWRERGGRCEPGRSHTVMRLAQMPKTQTHMHGGSRAPREHHAQCVPPVAQDGGDSD